MWLTGRRVPGGGESQCKGPEAELQSNQSEWGGNWQEIGFERLEGWGTGYVESCGPLWGLWLLQWVRRGAFSEFWAEEWCGLTYILTVMLLYWESTDNTLGQKQRLVRIKLKTTCLRRQHSEKWSESGYIWRYSQYDFQEEGVWNVREKEKSKSILKFWPEHLDIWNCHHLRCNWSRFIGFNLSNKFSVQEMKILRYLLDVQVPRGSTVSPHLSSLGSVTLSKTRYNKTNLPQGNW